MNRSVALTALLGFVLIGTAPLQAAEPQKVNGFYLNDLAAAQAEARRTGKPIFVVFRCEA